MWSIKSCQRLRGRLVANPAKTEIDPYEKLLAPKIIKVSGKKNRKGFQTGTIALQKR